VYYIEIANSKIGYFTYEIFLGETNMNKIILSPRYARMIFRASRRILQIFPATSSKHHESKQPAKMNRTDV
jgi:hypothetical protein